MPPQIPQYDYKILCADFLKKLVPILGADITFQTALTISDLELNADGSIKRIHGDPQLVFERLVTEFAEISRFVANFVTHELHVEHEENYKDSGAVKIE